MARSVENGRIESTHLGLEDHGIPTFWLHLKFAGTGQGFGGWDLRVYGIPLLMKIISVVGAENWEGLAGKLVRVERDGREYIVRLGNIVEDRWLDMDEERKKVEATMQEVSHG